MANREFIPADLLGSLSTHLLFTSHRSGHYFSLRAFGLMSVSVQQVTMWHSVSCQHLSLRAAFFLLTVPQENFQRCSFRGDSIFCFLPAVDCTAVFFFFAIVKGTQTGTDMHKHTQCPRLWFNRCCGSRHLVTPHLSLWEKWDTGRRTGHTLAYTVEYIVVVVVFFFNYTASKTQLIINIVIITLRSDFKFP